MKQYEGVADEELIVRLREGEYRITEYIMEKYKNLVRKKANALYLCGGDTEDLIQEGMIGLFRAVNEFDVTREVTFYHFAELCITRQLYTAIEASQRLKHAPLNYYISLSSPEGENADEMQGSIGMSDSPETFVIQKENIDQLWNAINKRLSKLEKEVLDYYLEGYNYRQIAEIMDKTPKTIDNALQRIRGKCSQMIDKSNNM